MLVAVVAEAGVPVVATIHPLADVVQAIGGDAVAVTTLLPPGASPHTFEPTPAQMRAVTGARVFVQVGAGLDTWTAPLLSAAGAGLVVLTATEGLALLSAAEGHVAEAHGGAPQSIVTVGDPHVWLDPVLVREHIVPAVARALSAAVPEQAQAIGARAVAYGDELGRLDADIRALLAPLSVRRFIAFHAAWRYFARRYGLEEVAVVEAFPGREPSARDIAMLVGRARELGVRSVLIEPQFSPRVAEQIAREFGGTVRLVDPVGGPGVAGREHYVDLLRYNARMFAEALHQ